jgi:DNA polymerase-3 subunit epsilon
VAFLEQFSQPKNRFADYAGFIHLNDKNEEIFGFGKYKGQLVKDVFAKDSGYFSWLQQADFPAYTKKVFTAIRLKNSNFGT